MVSYYRKDLPFILYGIPLHISEGLLPYPIKLVKTWPEASPPSQRGPEDAQGRSYENQNFRTPWVQTPPNILGSLEQEQQSGEEAEMEKLLAGCLGNSAPITFQPTGQPPRGPSFVRPGGGSSAARAARRELGAPGSASGRARRSRWAAHPRSKQGLSIFRAEEATMR